MDFAELAAGFEPRLDAVLGLVEAEWVREDWAGRNAQLEAALRPVPPADYLRLHPVQDQMFVGERFVAPELPFVLEHLADRAVLQEPAPGDPPTVELPGLGRRGSPNTVHHLHHLLHYEQLRPLGDAQVVVEWGAGFGNLARLLDALHPGAPTCVLIDIPVFSALQWLHLSLVCGPERVVLHTEPGTPLTPGCFNVVPLGLARGLDVAADLFVSTWALNESTPAAQKHVLERGFFGARDLLIAMNTGDPLEPAVLAAGARRHAIGAWMPGQHYFLR